MTTACKILSPALPPLTKGKRMPFTYRSEVWWTTVCIPRSVLWHSIVECAIVPSSRDIRRCGGSTIMWCVNLPAWRTQCNGTVPLKVMEYDIIGTCYTTPSILGVIFHGSMISREVSEFFVFIFLFDSEKSETSFRKTGQAIHWWILDPWIERRNMSSAYWEGGEGGSGKYPVFFHWGDIEEKWHVRKNRLIFETP